MQNGRANFKSKKNCPFTSDSGVHTVTIQDPITLERIELRHDAVLKKIWVQGYEIPGTFQHVAPSTADSQLFVNGLKVEVDKQGLWIDGQRVVNGVIQPMSQIIVEPESNPSSSLTFFPSLEANEEGARLLSKKDEKKSCCCAVM